MLMKSLLICTALALGLFLGSAQAGEMKEIVLKDGSVLTGEVVSLANGMYTVRSDSLGTIKLEESKVRAIRERPAAPGGALASNNSAAAADATSLQEKMMSDQEIMSKIRSLQDDPEFQALLQDPKIMQAVNAGDVAALSADPRFMKLLNNPTVRDIQNKVK
jgi:hypothetical protein